MRRMIFNKMPFKILSFNMIKFHNNKRHSIVIVLHIVKVIERLSFFMNVFTSKTLKVYF